MAPAGQVVTSFLYVPDKRPVFVFHKPEEAQGLEKTIKGAEIFGNKTHVFLPTPHGLEFVRGGHQGETAYVFHRPEHAEYWHRQLDGYGTMYPDGDNSGRTVFVGQQGQGYSGEPIWPGVA